MDRKSIADRLRRLTECGLPASAEIAGVRLTVTPLTRRAEDVAAVYGAGNPIVCSILAVLADLPRIPRTGDPVTLDGERYRVKGVSSHDSISLTIDLEAWK